MSVARSVVVGVGGRSEAAPEALLDLVAGCLADHGRTLADVTELLTIDRRADHPGVRRLRDATGAGLRTWPAEDLAREPATRSVTVARHTGTGSVAEAAVLAAGGRPLGSARKADGWVVVVGQQACAEPNLHHHGDTEVSPGMLDFAVNVHAAQPPEFLRHALVEAVADLARYPDPAPGQAALADLHGVPAESVLLTHGAAEAFTLLARQPWTHPAVVHPQFTEPEAALIAAAHRPGRVLLQPEDDFRLTPVEPEADLVVVGNPTNPTSRLHGRDELLALCSPGRTLVVDEAFLDAVEDPASPVDSLVRHAASDPGIVVVRSLTKTFSIAGLRVGYVVAHPDRISALAGRRTPWPVGTLATTAAVACASPVGRRYAALVRRELPERLSHLVAGLRDERFEVVPDPRGPFVLARREDAAAVRESLRSKGIAVRRGDTFPGLDGTWLRFAARDVAAVDVLLDAL